MSATEKATPPLPAIDADSVRAYQRLLSFGDGLVGAVKRAGAPIVAEDLVKVLLHYGTLLTYAEQMHAVPIVAEMIEKSIGKNDWPVQDPTTLSPAPWYVGLEGCDIGRWLIMGPPFKFNGHSECDIAENLTEADAKAIVAWRNSKDEDEALTVEELKERDEALELIADVARHFGCDEEWSNLHDHRECVREYIA